MKITSQTPQSLTSLLGFRLDYLYDRPNYNYNIQFEFDAGWQHEFLNFSTSLGFTPFHVVSTPTFISTVAPGRNSLILGADILATIGQGWQVEATLDYQWNSLFYDTFFYLGFGRIF